MTHERAVSSLDSVDYDPVDDLNALFSQPAALSSVSEVSGAIRRFQQQLDDDLNELVALQASTNREGVQQIQVAKDELGMLFEKVGDVRARAIQTEQSITEMTADIKRLDNTKKNLALSMTALKRLQMLTTAYDQLRELSTSRQYKECAQLLQAVIQLMAHFKSYRSIDQIATLSRNVSDLQREMLEQVCEDFEFSFAKGEVSQRRIMLSESCLVMDALGDNTRSRLILWYCNTQLREYRQVFRGNEEAASLDNISRRYSWFKRLLATYDNQHAFIFPPYWRVNEMLANAFCEGTREDFKAILARSIRRADGQSLDVNLLLSCLQETLDFEHGLERRFATASRTSVDTLTSNDDKAPGFSQAISEAFEPYLSVWVEAQDKQLSTMLPKYRQQPLRPSDEEFSPQMVIASSTELFNFYRLTLAQCAKLSTGARLAELSKVFAKYLDQYAQLVLLHYISERPSGSTPSRVPSIEDIILVLNTADYCYNTCMQLEEKIKTRIDENIRSSIDLQSQADAFMGIASASVRSLVRRVEIDLEPSWREMRNTGWSTMESVGDHSSYVGEMLRRIKARSSEILSLIHKQQYARAFCDNLVEFLANAYIANIIQCRPISEVGAEQMLLDSYVLKKSFEELLNPPPPSYLKRINTTMSRLDPLLKTLQVRPSPPEALVQAYLIHIADKSDANFRKILDLKGITRKQDQASLIDLFQAHKASPRNENLAQFSAFLTPILISSASSSGGAGVGVGVGSGSGMNIGAAGVGVGAATSSLGSSLSSAGLTASTLNLPLPGRFDPSTFGNAIMTAARDGVDRFGSGSPNNPAIHQNGTDTTTTTNTTAAAAIAAAASRAMSPPPVPASGAGGGGGGGAGSSTFSASQGLSTQMNGEGSSVNQNLKNIGKFFKRDLGGLGTRFAGGKD